MSREGTPVTEPIMIEAAKDGGFIIRTYSHSRDAYSSLLFAGDLKSVLGYAERHLSPTVTMVPHGTKVIYG